jgi:hypothetical protein
MAWPASSTTMAVISLVMDAIGSVWSACLAYSTSPVSARMISAARERMSTAGPGWVARGGAAWLVVTRPAIRRPETRRRIVKSRIVLPAKVVVRPVRSAGAPHDARRAQYRHFSAKSQ